MAEQFKDRLKLGQRGTFTPSHQPNLQLAGKIQRVHMREDCVDVLVDKDGDLVQIDNLVVTVPAKDFAVTAEPEIDLDAIDKCLCVAGGAVNSDCPLHGDRAPVPDLEPESN